MVDYNARCVNNALTEYVNAESYNALADKLNGFGSERFFKDGSQ
jgi:hypothetical protein